MKKIKYLIVGSLVIFITLGCERAALPESFKTLTVEEAKIELNNDDSIILIDVRTEEEYAEDHLDGSILIPIDELEARINLEILDKNIRIFVYCQSGKRSEEASKILVGLGYKNVYNIKGLDYW